MEQVEHFLRETLGLDPASLGPGLVERGVRERMKRLGISTIDTYRRRLDSSRAEVAELAEQLVVAETWFFRDREAYAFLASLVASDWRPGRAERPVRLLSVPCASGEEPYSMAMALLDAGLKAGEFRIDAMDVSATTIARARRAVYGKRSFRGDDLSYRERYFFAVRRGFALKKHVRDCVRFQAGNLLEAIPAAGSEAYDYIFFRNLMIYFHGRKRPQAAAIISQFLAPEGVLFVGSAELPLMIEQGFVSLEMPMAFACRKRPAARPVAAASSTTEASPPSGQGEAARGNPDPGPRVEPLPAPSPRTSEELQPCWNEAGVYGKGDCPELLHVIHCRNCPVYSEASVRLLKRPASEEYRREWTELVARRKQLVAASNTTAVIFRLGAEWLALPTHVFQEVAEPRPIHSLPHRKDGHVLGLANVRGELMLCVSLGHWLQLDNQPPRETLRQPRRRLLVINWSGHSFAFPTDFVHGTHRFNLHDLQPSPASLARSGQASLRGVLHWQERAVGFLDADQVFSSLNRSLT